MTFLNRLLACLALCLSAQALALTLSPDPFVPGASPPRRPDLQAPTPRASGKLAAAKRPLVADRTETQARTAPGWLRASFVYETAGRPLPEVLRDFGGAMAVPTVVSEAVEGKVRGRFDSSAGEFLDGLVRSFGINWYFDGQVLYVYAAREFQTRVYRLQGYDHRRIEALQSRLGWGDARYPLRFSAKDQTLLVAGPPRHLELIGQLIDALDTDVRDKQRKVVEVVPLRFAWAADRTVQGALVPGVASLMQSLFSNAGEPRAAEPVMPTSETPYQQLLKSVEPRGGATRAPSLLDLMAGRRSTAERGGGSTADVPTLPLPPLKGRPPASKGDGEQPLFVADPNNNAVLVSGNPMRMAHYVEAIRQLDVEPVLLELEALILDVSSEQTEQLGLTWSVSSRAGSLSWDMGGAATGASPQTVQALWTQAGTRIQMQLQAMVKDGRARLVARPKVVAVANQVAVLNELRRASVKVAGNLEARLFTVETGTVIQVLPQVQSVQGSYRIRLHLHVEDGDFETLKVDGVPIVRRLQIDTEARLTEGESVLLGGITADRQSQQRLGVPGLSDLPLIGGLFRSTALQSERSERLFMITPRIIRPARLADARPLPEDLVREMRAP